MASKSTLEKVFDVLTENNRRAGRLQGIPDYGQPHEETLKKKDEQHRNARRRLRDEEKSLPAA